MASSTTPIPPTRADWTASGACTSGSTVPPGGATRRACGGAATTNTTRAERSRGCGPTALYCRRDDMSEAYAGGRVCGAIDHESGNAAALGAAGWLSLAAAPTFAIMALLTGVLGGGPPDMLCSAAQHASQLGGMVP